jgi:hypothetical protein
MRLREEGRRAGNTQAGRLSVWKGQLIERVCDEVISEAMDETFRSMWQTGSGTQSNMSVNEVTSNRCIQLVGGSACVLFTVRCHHRQAVDGCGLGHPDSRPRHSLSLGGVGWRRGARRRGRCWIRWPGRTCCLVASRTKQP